MPAFGGQMNSSFEGEVENLGCGRIVLASASPRRREILASLGIEFALRPADVVEAPLPEERPEQMAGRLARAKARAALPQSGELALGADTVVALEGKTMGKPAGPTEALLMLRELRGRWHKVITAVALVSGPPVHERTGIESTRVRMRDYSDREVQSYVASGEPLDKAGGYAIQDPVFHPVERIEGCYLNVVGLPVCKLLEGLQLFGCPVENLNLGALPPECRSCPELSTFLKEDFHL